MTLTVRNSADGIHCSVRNPTYGSDSSIRDIADDSGGSIGHVADCAHCAGSDTCVCPVRQRFIQKGDAEESW